jgi:hypothetical protein
LFRVAFGLDTARIKLKRVVFAYSAVQVYVPLRFDCVPLLSLGTPLSAAGLCLDELDTALDQRDSFETICQGDRIVYARAQDCPIINFIDMFFSTYFLCVVAR